MVAAKPLATALFAVCFSGAALAATPAVEIRASDQARAESLLLRQSDFGDGWAGGQTPTTPLDPPSCPGFRPSHAGLVVRGHADARFRFAQAGVLVSQDVEVLATVEQVREDFARTMTAKLPSCLAAHLRRSAGVVSATVARLPFPPAGAVDAVYRATVSVHSAHARAAVVSDFVYIGEGRVEYSLNVVAPLAARDQLGRFELAVAQILVRRAQAAQSHR